ncbi:DUF1223 domain-containing protein [Flavobacteriaceae bacterium M23B6Z8]
MKHLILFFLMATIFNSYVLHSQKQNDRPVVLELFTSQGCSSCPPADRLLSEVKARFGNEKVIALSYHVDYWDRLGWKDPFSNYAFTEKQRNYARKFKSNSLYTPQIVVNGKKGFVGSRKAALLEAIQSYDQGTSVENVKIEEIKQKDQILSITATVENTGEGLFLRYLLVIDERITSIKRGENRDLKLRNSNVVVAEKEVEVTKSALRLSLPIPALVKSSDALSIVLLLVDEQNTIITGVQKDL